MEKSSKEEPKTENVEEKEKEEEVQQEHVVSEEQVVDHVKSEVQPTIPVLLNLETMYEELIHEPDFVESHKEVESGRHVKQAILLQHGLDMSADSWFHQDKDGVVPMPIRLWEAGYDVWLGNNRGTGHS